MIVNIPMISQRDLEMLMIRKKLLREPRRDLKMKEIKHREEKIMIRN